MRAQKCYFQKDGCEREAHHEPYGLVGFFGETGPDARKIEIYPHVAVCGGHGSSGDIEKICKDPDFWEKESERILLVTKKLIDPDTFECRIRKV